MSTRARRRPGPSPEEIATLPRLLHGLRCWDQATATVVVDLRRHESVFRSPAAEVLAAGPIPREHDEKWHQQIEPIDGSRSRSRWEILGRVLSTHGNRTDSVLLATDTTEEANPWRLAVLVSETSHGAFARDWCIRKLPTVADAFMLTGGTSEATRQRHVAAKQQAAVSLDALRQALTDPVAWAGDLTVPIRDWDAEAGDWMRSQQNLGLFLAWASAGIPQRRFIADFQEQSLGLPAAFRVQRAGHDVELVTAMLRAVGMDVSASRLTPLVEDIAAFFEPETATAWLNSLLGVWFFNSPRHAARMRDHGWTCESLLRLGHTVAKDPQRRFAVEVLLWERTVERLPAQWRADLVPVSVWVESGVSRGDVASTLLAAQATEPDAEAAARKVREGLEMLAGLSRLTDEEGREGAVHVSSTLTDRVPRGYNPTA